MMHPLLALLLAVSAAAQSFRDNPDIDVCDRTRPVTTLSSGTIHDDEPDSGVDCVDDDLTPSQIASCGDGSQNTFGYGNNLDCGINVHAGKDQRITLVFAQLNLEGGPRMEGGIPVPGPCADPGCDYISIYDGEDDTAPLIAQLTGHAVPLPITSRGRDVFVRFQTDHGNAGISSSIDPGFFLDWHFVDVEANNICELGQSILTTIHGELSDDMADAGVACTGATCSGANMGIFSQQFQRFLPKFPLPFRPKHSEFAGTGYGDNLHCGTRIHAPSGSTILWQFSSINLEETARQGCSACPAGGCDTVSLYDGSSAAAPLLGTFSGNHVPGVVRTTQQDLWIQFNTDGGNCGIQDSTSDPGWFGEWTVVDGGVNICHPSTAVLTASHGVLHDDEPSSEIDCTGDGRGACNGADGDRGYGDNLDCSVRVHAPAGHTISFDFDNFNLEQGFDYLELFDGADDGAPSLGRYSGSTPPPSITSTGRDLFVRFTTDVGNAGINYPTDPGFFGHWAFHSPKDHHGVADGPCEDTVMRPACPQIIAMGVTCDSDMQQLAGNDPAYAGQHLSRYCPLSCGECALAPPPLPVHAPPPPGCTDTPPGWASSTGNSCDQYVNSNWCTVAGGYGPGWLPDQYGPFSRWQVDGVDAGQACCGCGGGSTGVYHAPPPPSPGGIVGPPPPPAHLECVDRSEVCPVITLVGGVCDENMEQVTGDAQFAGATVEEICRLSCNNCNGAPPPPPPPSGGLPPPPPSVALKGYAPCMDHLKQEEDALGHTCCADGCPNGTPDVCSQECAAVWMPFSKHCSSFLSGDPMLAMVLPLSTACEEAQYGRYTGAVLGGRCSPVSEHGYQTQLTAAGCALASNQCSDDCAEVFLEFYAGCHPRFETEANAAQYDAFLAVCQGNNGGGH